MDGATLQKTITLIVQIEEAGLLSEMEANISAAHRDRCRSDLKRYPLLAPMVEKIAGVASRSLCLPLDQCIGAACEAMLPDTWRGLALEEIRRLAAIALFGPEPTPEKPATKPAPKVCAGPSGNAVLQRERRRGRK